MSLDEAKSALITSSLKYNITLVEQDFKKEVIDGDVAVRLSDRSGEVEAGYVNDAGIKRGDDSLKDWYVFMNVSLGVSLETMFGWMRPKRCKL